MSRYFTALFIMVLIIVGCGDSSETAVKSESTKAVEAAYMLCTAMKGTGLTSECEVKGWGSTVDVRMDTSGAEARKICAGVVEMMAAKTRDFRGKWELRIFSPFSGDHPLATCRLR